MPIGFHDQKKTVFFMALSEIQGEVLPFVSRGGLKLQKAIEVFGIDLHEKIAIDIGASTGGFTDCMLQKGVKKAAEAVEKILKNGVDIAMNKFN